MSKLVDKQSQFLLMVCKLVHFATDLGYQVTGGELERTREAAALNAKQCDGILNSKHCSRLAIDLNFYRGGKYVIPSRVNLEAIGSYWESLGGRWGGRFTKYDDSGHFELP